jgi:hypothetical protein
MFPECLARMVAIMEKHSSVGIVSAYGLANTWVVWCGLPYGSDFFSGREVCRQRLLGGPYVFGSPTSVLFRSDLVRSHDPFYDESHVQPDSAACFELLKESDFGFSHQVLTFTRDLRPGSMLEASWNLNTAAAGFLHELITYGPFYLTPQEYQSRLQVTVSKYYDFLATSLLQRRNSNFWEFHRKKLQEQGLGLSYSKLLYLLGKRIFRKLFPGGRSSEAPQWGL